MKDLAVKYYKQLWHYLRSGLYAHTTQALATLAGIRCCP